MYKYHIALILVLIITLFPPLQEKGYAQQWEWMNPYPTTLYLYELWGASGSDLFAVGDEGKILHYDGTSWSAMDSGTTYDIQGLWGTSGTDVFVAGSGGMIFHYTAGAWQNMSSVTTEHLLGVWGSSSTDVFVIEMNGSVLRSDGASWSTMDVGDYMSSNGGIWGSSGTDIFVVADYGEVSQYNGSSWNSYIYNGELHGNHLYDVWGVSGSDVFAVGWSDTIIRYNRSSWSTMSSGVSSSLYGVWCACQARTSLPWGRVAQYCIITGVHGAP